MAPGSSCVLPQNKSHKELFALPRGANGDSCNTKLLHLPHRLIRPLTSDLRFPHCPMVLPLSPMPQALSPIHREPHEPRENHQFTHTKTRRHSAEKPQPNLGGRRQVKVKDFGRNMVGRKIIAASFYCHGYFCQEFGPSVWRRRIRTFPPRNMRTTRNTSTFHTKARRHEGSTNGKAESRNLENRNGFNF